MAVKVYSGLVISAGFCQICFSGLQKQQFGTQLGLSLNTFSRRELSGDILVL